MESAQKDHQIRRRVLVGSASNYVGQGIAVLTLFLLTPFLLDRLGTTLYGLWVLVGSVVAYGVLLDFGVWGALIKYVAEFHARGDHDQAHHFIATALRIYTAVGLCFTLLCAAAAPVFPLLFRLPAGQHSTAVRLVLLMGLGVGLSLPLLTPMAVLRGLQRFDIVNLVDGVAMLLTTLATVAALLLGAGVLGVALANIAGIFIVSFASTWFLRRIAPELRYGWRGAQRGLVRKILAYSWPLFIKETALRLQNRTDEITIGAFLPVHFIPPYNLARRLSETTYMLTKQYMKVLLPLASELHAEQDLPRLRAVFVAGTRLTLALSLAIGCTLIVLAEPVLTLWVGAEFAAAAPLVTTLTCASIIATSQWPAGAVLQGMARHRILAVTSLSAGIANLALSVALIRPLGLTGVALGTLVPTIIEFFILFPYATRIIGVRPAEAVKEICLPALIPAVLMVLTLLGLRRVIPTGSLASLAAVAGLGFIVFAAGYFSIHANRAERETFRGLAFHIYRFAIGHLRRVE